MATQSSARRIVMANHSRYARIQIGVAISVIAAVPRPVRSLQPPMLHKHKLAVLCKHAPSDPTQRRIRQTLSFQTAIAKMGQINAVPVLLTVRHFAVFLLLLHLRLHSASVMAADHRFVRILRNKKQVRWLGDTACCGYSRQRDNSLLHIKYAGSSSSQCQCIIHLLLHTVQCAVDTLIRRGTTFPLKQSPRSTQTATLSRLCV